jgi:predicted house-cleaning noncanonical NTP pyrophosphatase (MazG superfamily)
VIKLEILMAKVVLIVHLLTEQQGISLEEFKAIRVKKKEKRGGFKEKLLLLNVEE